MRRSVKTVALTGVVTMLAVAVLGSSAEACHGKKKCKRGCGRHVRVVTVSTCCGGQGYTVSGGGYAGTSYGGGYVANTGYAGGGYVANAGYAGGVTPDGYAGPGYGYGGPGYGYAGPGYGGQGGFSQGVGQGIGNSLGRTMLSL